MLKTFIGLVLLCAGLLVAPRLLVNSKMDLLVGSVGVLLLLTGMVILGKALQQSNRQRMLKKRIAEAKAKKNADPSIEKVMGSGLKANEMAKELGLDTPIINDELKRQGQSVINKVASVFADPPRKKVRKKRRTPPRPPQASQRKP
ncbi:MAG: hypothetical protein K6A65_05205 [Succinivibrionaceae bacterium]|nr:hypothetical protein [Succinivibrionaceae bacterium]